MTALAILASVSIWCWHHLSRHIIFAWLINDAAELEVVGPKESCSSEQIREFSRQQQQSNRRLRDPGDLATALADHCRVERTSLAITGFRQIRAELMRTDPAFIVHCQPLPNRLLSSGGGLYPVPSPAPEIPELHGFDRKLCKDDIWRVSAEISDLMHAVGILSVVRDTTRDKGHILKSVAARDPRGYEITFHGVPHRFVISSNPTSAELDRLLLALRDKTIAEPSIISLDLNERIVIRKGIPHAIRQ